MRSIGFKEALLVNVILLSLVTTPFATLPVIAHRDSVVTYFASNSDPSMPLPSIHDAIPMPSPDRLAPVTGALRVLVVAVKFSDVNNTKSLNDIRQEFFGTVNNYYQEISYGAVSIEGDVVGWYNLNYSMVYYGRDCLGIDDADCGGQPTSWWLARDGAAAAQNYVNFNNYDYYVFLHAGPGEESSKNKDDIWSVAYLGGIWIPTKYKSISQFVIIPETEAQGAVPIGVYAHEFGHLLGLPDLYDIATGKTVMGPWSLMDKGLWNGNPPGSSPAHMEAYSKIKLGWISGSYLGVANSGLMANFTIYPTEVASNGVHAVQIPVSLTSPPKQYYLVEVRQRVGFDAALPSSGVLITYVDETALYRGVTVIDGHPNIPGLTDATWRAGQLFTAERNNLAVAITGQDGNAFQITINRRGPMPDLRVAKIFTSPSKVSPNTTVTVFIDIVNQGTMSTSNVPIQIYLDGQPFVTTQVSVPAGSTREISATWKAVAGSHIFRVVIDPYDSLTELNKANNDESFALNVGPTLIITVPLGASTNASAWVRVNGIQYYPNSSMQVETSVAAGNVTVEVQTAVYTATGTRQQFVAWSDGSAQNPRQMSIMTDTALKAVYKTQYLLAVDHNGGTVSGGGWYDTNTTVTITAISPSNVTALNSRMLFTNWSGDMNLDSPTLTVIVTKPVVVKANWRTQYYLNVVSLVGSASGSGWYDAGATASLSVQSPVQFQNRTRQVFTGWEGAVQSQNTIVNLVVYAPTTVQATWLVQYYVEIQSPYGNLPASDWRDAGTDLQISIQPQIEYSNRTQRVFTGWAGDYSGTNTSFTLNVNSPKTLIAKWITQYQLTFKVGGVPNSTHVKLNVNNTYYDISVSNIHQAWFNQGEQISPATNQTMIDGFLQFEFAGWRNSTGSTVSPPFTVNGPMDYTAFYQQTFALPPIPGFPIESILAGIVMGLMGIALLRRRKCAAIESGNTTLVVSKDM